MLERWRKRERKEEVERHRDSEITQGTRSMRKGESKRAQVVEIEREKLGDRERKREERTDVNSREMERKGERKRMRVSPRECVCERERGRENERGGRK